MPFNMKYILVLKLILICNFAVAGSFNPTFGDDFSPINIAPTKAKESFCKLNSKKEDTSKLYACPKGEGFRPLSNIYTAKDLFISYSCGMNDNILLDLYSKVKTNKNDISIHVVLKEECESNLDKLNLDVDKIFTTEERIYYWQQDPYEFGVVGEQNEISILNLPYDREELLPKKIANSCKLSLNEFSNSDYSHISKNSGNSGGNIEAYPGNIVVIGNNVDNDIVDHLEKSNDLVVFDTSFLDVKHVDLISNVVRINNGKNKNECDFAIFKASPKLAMNLIRDNKIKVENSYIPENKLFELNNNYQKIIDKNINQLVNKIKKNTNCKNIKQIELPILFNENGEPSWSDPVNSIVLDDYLIFPDTKNVILNDYITNEFKKIGIKTDSINVEEYHRNAGEIHCGTNILRACR